MLATTSLDSILQIQSGLLNLSKGLIPLGALAYSAVHSWHCSMMCGPLIYSKKKNGLHNLLTARLAAYSTMGGIAGLFGQLIKNSLEVEVVSVFAFLGFAILTIAWVVPNLIPKFPRISLGTGFKHSLSQRISPAMRGLLFAAIPCHLLAFYYGLAALTQSPAWGMALLFGHGVMTTPALAYTWKFATLMKKTPKGVQYILRLVLLALILLNLSYFASRIFYTKEEAKNHILFCL